MNVKTADSEPLLLALKESDGNVLLDDRPLFCVDQVNKSITMDEELFDI